LILAPFCGSRASSNSRLATPNATAPRMSLMQSRTPAKRAHSRPEASGVCVLTGLIRVARSWDG
jgi:hypothetical protein